MVHREKIWFLMNLFGQYQSLILSFLADVSPTSKEQFTRIEFQLHNLSPAHLSTPGFCYSIRSDKDQTIHEDQEEERLEELK